MRGPDSWFELLERVRDRMTHLQNLADISRGFTSGADRFYCVRDVTQHYLDTIPDSDVFFSRWGDFSRGHEAHTHSARWRKRGAPAGEAFS